MHKSAPVIMLFRQDLRIADNPALHLAVETNAPIIPVFILDDQAAGDWQYGAAQRVLLHEALHDLSMQLKKCGATLILRQGDTTRILRELISETNASEIFWNRRYEEWAIAQDTDVKQHIGIPVQSFNGKLLAEPWEIKTGQKTPYKVFTPYWRSMQNELEKKHPIPFPTMRTINGHTQKNTKR